MRIFILFFSSVLMMSIVSGCSNVIKPVLPEMEAAKPSQTLYTTALQDLNTILRIYYPHDSKTFFFYVKPISDSTGLSGTGEIPRDITTMVRDAISQISHKVRYVEQYDVSDQIHLQVEQMLIGSSKIQTQGYQHLRPNADFTITGGISMFDRNLESVSDKAEGMASIGGGQGQTQMEASFKTSSNFSRLGVSFNVFLENGVNVPGRFGGEMNVWMAKNSDDIGFSIMGTGLGFGGEATAMHGRHQALRMLTEFSVVQIVGRTLNVPYWRVGQSRKIFDEDSYVINSWIDEYRSYLLNPTQLIAYMQAQCIACGDNSVSVNGYLDNATLESFDRFAQKFGISDRNYPNFDLYKALECNRLLNTSVADRAWAAYNAYKAGVSPSAPAVTPAATSQPKPAAPAPKKPVRSAPRPQPVYEEDVTAPLEGLL